LAEFVAFPKIPRLRRAVLITEKIDGTNACVVVEGADTDDPTVTAQSRNRIITPEQDNAGFAKWVAQNAETLAKELGDGYHFGEWWGVGIQRGYDLRERRFSLFNVSRWKELSPQLQEIGVSVVPILASGPMSDETIEFALNKLRTEGSAVAPGYPAPEGIVVRHQQSGQLFKVLLENDELPKGLVA
jgi:hypothetical protein